MGDIVLSSGFKPDAVAGAYRNYVRRRRSRRSGLMARQEDAHTLQTQPALYWGSNLPRLVELKAQYDPTNVRQSESAQWHG